jgi:hypothetical protein
MQLQVKLRRDQEVSKAIAFLEQEAGWERWYAKNIVLWRLKWRLPILPSKVL